MRKKSVSRREALKRGAVLTASAALSNVAEGRGNLAESPLSPEQQAMEKLWEEHMADEFKIKSADATMRTMTGEPSVNHVPVSTGGFGSRQVRHFYGKYFIPQMPPDTQIVPISRTIGRDRLVDELVFKFTHTVQMDWMLPGVRPTNKPVESVTVVVVQFEGGKIASERIYWDQASVLVQLGLLDAGKLPVSGVAAAKKVLDPRLPSNDLIKRTVDDKDL